MLNKIKQKLKINKIITIDDYKKYGCINCNTINIPELKTEDNFGYKKITCQKCQTNFYVIDNSLLTPKNLIRKHPNQKEGKLLELEDKRPENQNEDYCIYSSSKDNEILFEVYSKNAAKRIVNMFDKNKNDNIFDATIIEKEDDPLNIYVKIKYTNFYKALALKNEIIKNDNKINKEIIKMAIELELDFKNKWQKCCLFRNIFDLSNVEYIRSCVKEYKDTTDTYTIIRMKSNRQNILEIFETFGMYVQVNKELENDNILQAIKCILHYASNIDTNYSKQKTLENKEYVNNSRKNLQNDLINLLKTYLIENSGLMNLKITDIDPKNIKSIDITNHTTRQEFKFKYETIIKPLLEKLIDEDIIRKLTIYVNEKQEPLTDEQTKNNFLLTYLLYGFKLQMETELEKPNYKDAYLAIEYLLERLNSPLHKMYFNKLEDENTKKNINILKAHLQIMYNDLSKTDQTTQIKDEPKKRKLSLFN